MTLTSTYTLFFNNTRRYQSQISSKKTTPSFSTLIPQIHNRQLEASNQMLRKTTQLLSQSQETGNRNKLAALCCGIISLILLSAVTAQFAFLVTGGMLPLGSIFLVLGFSLYLVLHYQNIQNLHKQNEEFQILQGTHSLTTPLNGKKRLSKFIFTLPFSPFLPLYTQLLRTSSLQKMEETLSQKNHSLEKIHSETVKQKTQEAFGLYRAYIFPRT